MSSLAYFGEASGVKTMRAGILSRLDVGDRLVDVGERPGLPDDARLPGRVQLEDLAKIDTRADDRADHGDAVENGLEDGQLDVVLRRQGDEDERPSAA